MPTYIPYVSTNPCICPQNAPSPSPTPTPTPAACECVVLCNIVVNATSDTAVGPCGAEGTLDITASQYGHDTCACGENALVWSVASFDTDIFVTATIDSETGVLTWRTMGPEAFEKQYGTIVVKLCCGQLSAYMHVTIGIKDLCNCSGTPPCDGCDPCTGLTISQTVNTKVRGVTTGANISVIS